MTAKPSYPLVSSQHFIIAVRESGYRSPTLALAEIVDNSIQAGATSIRICVGKEESGSLSISVLDDGCGMDSNTLRTALQFGGSTRFGSRNGIGRFGMGLPSSSVSQARRLEVYTWQRGGRRLFSYLDVDEIAGGETRTVPEPIESSLPTEFSDMSSFSGTLVVWRQCDRSTAKRPDTLARHFRENLGRLFRYFIWDGISLTVNGFQVRARDPLMCHHDSVVTGAKFVGEPILYPVRTDCSKTPSVIQVRFSSLPVEKWYSLPSTEKKNKGVIRHAGVSIVRAGREIDSGWFFMGEKRKENYDDWWRAEVSFDPVLDDYFGITNSKQGIRPSQELRSILEPDMEEIARDLSRKVRDRFTSIRNNAPSSAELVAGIRDKYLPGIKVATPFARSGQPDVLRGDIDDIRYEISASPLNTSDFYRARVVEKSVLMELNSQHSFYVRYLQDLQRKDPGLSTKMKLVLLALARSEALSSSDEQRLWYSVLRKDWSDSIQHFLK